MNLQHEKQNVLEIISEWVAPLKDSDNIATHEMLQAMKAKIDSLIKSDF